MSIEEINHLSYPQLKLITSKMYEIENLNMVIPYMGDGSNSEESKPDSEIENVNDFSKLISQMNTDFEQVRK